MLGRRRQERRVRPPGLDSARRWSPDQAAASACGLASSNIETVCCGRTASCLGHELVPLRRLDGFCVGDHEAIIEESSMITPSEVGYLEDADWFKSSFSGDQVAAWRLLSCPMDGSLCAITRTSPTRRSLYPGTSGNAGSTAL